MSVSSRPTWSTEQVPGQTELYRETQSGKTKREKEREGVRVRGEGEGERDASKLGKKKIQCLL